MPRAYVAFFCLAVLAVASAQEKEAEKPAAEPYDSTVVKAEGTPELPVVEFDKLPEDVKKVVGEKLVEQAMKDQAPGSISIPVDAQMSEELKNDLITLMQMKNANMIPFDLLTPESKEIVAKALYAQELEKRAKEAVVNYDSMTDEEKEHVRALFKESGINRPALGAQRPVADPVSFRMGQFGGAHQRYPYNPYSAFFRSHYQPEQYYGYRNYPYSPYNYNPYNYNPYPYYPY